MASCYDFYFIFWLGWSNFLSPNLEGGGGSSKKQNLHSKTSFQVFFKSFHKVVKIHTIKI
jgi:hypothetical protein